MSSQDEKELELKGSIGHCNWNLMYCDKCPLSLASTCETNFGSKSWCVKLGCSKCSCSWYVCNTCTGSRNRMMTSVQISRHHRCYHTQKSDPVGETNDEITDPGSSTSDNKK